MMMKRFISVKKHQGNHTMKVMVDVNAIVAIEEVDEKNTNQTSFQVFFDCAIWSVDMESYDELVKGWKLWAEEHDPKKK